MSTTLPAGANGVKETNKRRREPKKGKAATKKKEGKDAADRVEPQEEDIVWEAVVVPNATNSEEDNDAEEEFDAHEVAGRLPSDDGVPPRPSGPMIRSGTVKAPSDVEGDSDDIDAPQDGTIKRLVQSVRNRKRQTGRGHQLPPEERAREKELAARRKEKADKRRQRQENAAAGITHAKESAGVEANTEVGDKDAVIEIDMKERKALKESQGSDGPKKKTLRMTKVEKEIYRNAHHTLLLAYVAHLQQLSNAANCDELHALLLSLLPAAEWPKRDSQGVPHTDVQFLLSLCRWVRATFATAEPASATSGAEEKEEKALFTPVKKRKASKKDTDDKKESKSATRKKKEKEKEQLDIANSKEAGDEGEIEESPGKKKKQAARGKAKKRKSKGGDESDFEKSSDESDGEEEEEGEEEEIVEEKPLVGDDEKEKKKRLTSPKASASPLKTQAEPVNVAMLPPWSVDWWTQRLLAVARRERTATHKEQQVLLVCLLRALGVDARCVCSLSATPLAKTKDFSLMPEKDEEAAGKPYPAHGNDLALDMCWTEVYSPQLHRWVPVDAAQSIVNKPQYAESLLNTGARRGFTSLAYVLGIDRRNACRDVTRRYAKSFASVASALRTDRDWWNRTLQGLSPVPDTEAAERDRDEEEELAAKEAETGEFPSSKELYRKHPLYVLEKFVGKFDVIYPKEKPLGYCGKEAIWPRSALHHLHTQDGWLKEGRQVRIGETPIKRVPKRQRKKKEGSGEELKALDTELFGLWQTETYERPVAVDGVVPKNEHGNVYLYQKWMLPLGCVQVNLPQIARTCRYLRVDYAQALVGWEPRGGFNCPVFEGVVICEEHYDAVREAWEEHYSRRIAKEAQEQRSKAIRLWRKFAKALLVRDRLKRTYAAQPEAKGGDEGETEAPVRQLPTVANRSRHIHSFGPGTQDESGKWSKACGCGYSVEYEEI